MSEALSKVSGELFLVARCGSCKDSGLCQSFVCELKLITPNIG